MKFQIDVNLSYSSPQECEFLLQIEAASTTHQKIEQSQLDVFSGKQLSRMPAEELVGYRVWFQATDRFACKYSAVVALNRPKICLTSLQQTPLSQIPCDVVKYLMPSRYCIPEDFQDFTVKEFGNHFGGAAICAMRNWIEKNLSYVRGSSSIMTDATTSFTLGKGVCRDYSHVLIAMARAIAIPARFVSAYGPNVIPQDFHALVEVYLDGAWHLIDPTGMSTPDETIIIGVGRDAADVSFLSSYGIANFEQLSVDVRCV
ncbi:transglutaminase family protein [Alphaproteobacteria bacterium]|nr:transglutaminase family protein [Alphaproteobacteria bacterium]